MGMEEKTRFELDKSKCVKCGNCINVCSGMVLGIGQDGYPEIEYMRGVQKELGSKNHRWTQKKSRTQSTFERT